MGGGERGFSLFYRNPSIRSWGKDKGGAFRWEIHQEFLNLTNERETVIALKGDVLLILCGS